MSDFLVIGGGIAGISAAARLSELGSVTVLEAEDALGYHATGRSAAIFLPDYGNDVVRALNYASFDYLDGSGLLSPREMMLLAKPDEREAFDTEVPSFNMSEISLDAAAEKFPILNKSTVGYAAIRAGIYDLDTDLMVQGFAKAARENGAEIVTDARVSRVEKSGARWRVTSDMGEFEGKTLVNATGAWADHVAGLAGITALGIQPYRRSFAQLAAPGGHDVTGWPFVDGVGEAWYAKPSAGKLLVSPSEEDPMDPFDAYADDMVLAEGLARYQEMVTEPVTRPETTWAGLRSFAPDRALVLGRDINEPDFIWCAGQGGYGFQTAAAASALLADLIAGRIPELYPVIVKALSPDRFA
ncbi:MAG: FAD-dependent oxidoreductase [Pseudomonadota bacterium]